MNLLTDEDVFGQAYIPPERQPLPVTIGDDPDVDQDYAMNDMASRITSTTSIDEAIDIAKTSLDKPTFRLLTDRDIFDGEQPVLSDQDVFSPGPSILSDEEAGIQLSPGEGSLENDQSQLEGPEFTDQSKGYLNNVRDPVDLIKNESFVSNVFKIITGNTDNEKQDRKIGLDPILQSISDELGELEQQGRVDTPEYEKLYQTFTETRKVMDSEPEFDMGALWEAAKSDPGGTLAEFQNALLADPELLLTPLGWERAAAAASIKLAKAGKTIQTLGKTTAGATGAATTGAAVIAPISAAEQLNTEGEIDPGQLGKETALGAGASVAFAGLFQGLKGAFGKVSKATGKPIGEMESALKAEIESGKGINEAMDNVIELFGVKGKEAVELKTTVQQASKQTDTVLSKEAGSITPVLALGLAAPVAGGVLGYSPEHPEGAVAGAALATTAVLGGRSIYKVGKSVVKTITKKDPRIRIDDLTNKFEGDIATGQRATWQFKNSIDELVPDQSRREAISHWMEGDKSITLNPDEKKAAMSIRSYFNQLHDFAKNEDVLDAFLDDYVPHLWSQGNKTKSELMKAFTRRGVKNMSPRTPHAKQRTFATLNEGIDAGLVPRTLDIAEIAKLYGDSINRATRNKQLIRALGESVDPEGNKLVMRTDKAPKDYVLISHPSLQKTLVIKEGDVLTKTKLPIKVHPDIAPSLKFLFDASDPNIATRSLLALNFASKRTLVSMSAFHANALLESLLMSGRTPAAIPKALDMLRNGKAGDVVDVALRAGLKIGTIEDVGTDIFYGALKDIQSIADRSLATKPVKWAAQGIEKANRVVDDIMWDKIATGSKLAVFMKEYEVAILKNLKQHQKNPTKYPLVPKEKIAQEVAEFTNDAFGGQNWRRMAESVESKLGRDFALAINSPSGRRAMQLLFFAPDWTISNIRILIKAFPGMSKSKRQARLHQKYALRGAFYFATVANGINYMMTGRPIWENKVPSRVDLNDGRTMTFSKQFVEPFHWATQPGKTFVNKMGIIPRGVLEQALAKKWISPRYSPPMFKQDATEGEKVIARAKHVGSKFVPIFIQQIYDQGPSGVAGFLGHPIYGKKN